MQLTQDLLLDIATLVAVLVCFLLMESLAEPRLRYMPLELVYQYSWPLLVRCAQLHSFPGAMLAALIIVPMPVCVGVYKLIPYG